MLSWRGSDTTSQSGGSTYQRLVIYTYYAGSVSPHSQRPARMLECASECVAYCESLFRLLISLLYLRC